MIERYESLWARKKERDELLHDWRQVVQSLKEMGQDAAAKASLADLRKHSNLDSIAFHHHFCKILDDFGIHEEYFKALDFDDDMVDCGLETNGAQELLFKKMYGELYWEEKLKEES